MGKEARNIAVVGKNPVAVAPERVDRPDRPARIADLVDQRHHGFLVRNRDVAAGEFPFTQTHHEGRQIGGRHVETRIGAGDSILPQPFAMDQRRTRMRDGVADDEAARRHRGIRSAVEMAKLTQSRQHRQERQAEDGEMIPLDPLEELGAQPLELIAADARKNGRAGGLDIMGDE